MLLSGTFRLMMLFRLCIGWTGSSILGDYNISFSVDTNLTVETNASPDRCGTIVSTNNSVYHLHSNATSQYYLQQWTRPFASNSPSRSAIKLLPFRVRSVDVDYNSEQFAALNRNSREQYTYSSINASSTSHVMPNGGYTPTWSYIHNNVTARFGYDGSTKDIMEMVNLTSGSSHSNDVYWHGRRVAFSPDFTKAVMWEHYSEIHVYDVSGIVLTQIGVINSTHTSTKDLTEAVTFNRDGTLAILQTNGYHPLTIVNLTTATIQQEFPFAGNVLRTMFLEDTHILVLTNQSLTAIDRSTGHNIALASLNSFWVSDWDVNKNTLYLCKSSQISVMQLGAQWASWPYSTSTNSSSTEEQQQSTTLELEMSEWEQETTDHISRGLEITSLIFNPIILFSLSNPYTYYFLSFINFFTLSSHYVVINMPIPKTLYYHLSRFYTQMNLNVIARFWKLPFSKQSEERVNRSKLLDLELTTDMAVGHTANFAMALINILSYMVISCMIGRLRKHNLVRRMLQQPYPEIMFGQYFALVLPLTAPWVFFILGAHQNYSSKLNLISQYVFFLLSVLITASYLLYLVNKKNDGSKARDANCRKKHRSKPSSRAEQCGKTCQSKFTKPVKSCNTNSHSFKSPSKTKREQKDREMSKFQANRGLKIKDKLRNIVVDYKDDLILQRPVKTKAMALKPRVAGGRRKIIPAGAVQDWYVALCAFVYPLFVIISYTQIGLLCLLIFSLAGVFIAKQKRSTIQRINKVTMACYPVLFHMCFIIFRFITQRQYLVYTQIACLGILLLGSVHHLLFLCYEIITATCQAYRSSKVKAKSKDTAGKLPQKYSRTQINKIGRQQKMPLNEKNQIKVLSYEDSPQTENKVNTQPKKMIKSTKYKNSNKLNIIFCRRK